MSVGKTCKVWILSMALSLISGCKLALMIVDGGNVTSFTGTRDCAEGTICTFDVTSDDFYEEFTAVPKSADWRFVQWYSGDGFFCAGSTNPTCNLNAAGASSNEYLARILTSEQKFYLMPVFEKQLETVLVDGKEWARPRDFLEANRIQMSAACPGPDGVCNGYINGHNMAGWTWASREDLNDLFNFFIGSVVMGPGEDSYYQDGGDLSWAEAFLNTFQSTFSYYPVSCWFSGEESTLYEVAGRIRDINAFYRDQALMALLANCHGAADTDDQFDNEHPIGGWFYRIP